MSSKQIRALLREGSGTSRYAARQRYAGFELQFETRVCIWERSQCGDVAFEMQSSGVTGGLQDCAPSCLQPVVRAITGNGRKASLFPFFNAFFFSSLLCSTQQQLGTFLRGSQAQRRAKCLFDFAIVQVLFTFVHLPVRPRFCGVVVRYHHDSATWLLDCDSTFLTVAR